VSHGASVEERFWAKVDKGGPGGCWIWIGGRANGYGKFRPEPSRQVQAHRYAWELAHGEIADGLTIDHLCRIRCCVNPDHLEPVTITENIRRGVPYRRPGGNWDHRAPWTPPKGWRAEWERVLEAVDNQRRGTAR
jgi:hypothetical protein